MTNAAGRRLLHRALLAAPGGCSFDRLRATDQARLALVLEGVALLAHLEHGGWVLGDGSAQGAWDEATVADDGSLSVPSIRRGRRIDPPQIVALALLRRVFGVDEIAGRGAARRVARGLVELWRQELAPVPPDTLVEQMLEPSPLLWQPSLGEARRALVAVHVVDGVRHPWIVGPGRVRRRFLAASRDFVELGDLLASEQGRDLWDGVDDDADPRELAARGGWRRAAAAWRRRGRRGREEALEAASVLFALGRWEECLRLLHRRTDPRSLLQRLRAQRELGDRTAAAKTLGRIDPEALAPADRVELGAVAVWLAAGRGDRAALRRWTSRLLAIDADDGSRERALIVAAGAAWDSGDVAAMGDYLETAAASRPFADDELARRWLQMEGLRRFLLGDGPGAVEHVGQALARGRRRMLRAEAGRLWNDMAVARVLADDLAGAERACRHTLRLLGGCDGSSRITLALYNLGELRVRRGRLGGVEATLERSVLENRRARNPRGLLRDFELWARLELTQGRLDAALARCNEALERAATGDVPVRSAVFELFAARAHGWLERPDQALACLERGGVEALDELEPEERPVVWALAGAPDRALDLAHGGPWHDAWASIVAGRPPSLESWRAVDRLEPFRAARLVLDFEIAMPGAVPVLRARRAAATLRAAGAEGLAERLEVRSLGPWQVLGAYLEAPRAEPGALTELFAVAGHDEARLIWRRGDDETVLVDGAGGEAVARLAFDGGELELRCGLVDDASHTLLGLVRRDLESRPERPATPSTEEADRPPLRGGIVGTSEALVAALDRLDRLAAGELPVLILGESGTGKELAARRVHEISRRGAAPFLAVNCAALSESLVQSDLFGHVRGSFTGAERDRPGVFESARGGTVFLDEIGDLPLPLQGKLLRVLQEGEIRRVGESFARKVDVRILAATHRDLAQMVDAGAFRQDLFFRLKVAKVELPPLRYRGGDIQRLAEHFLNRIPGRRLRLDATARRQLSAYGWPGNVRELRNVLEVAAALTSDETIRIEHLDLQQASSGGRVGGVGEHSRDYHGQVEEFRRRLLTTALERAGGNRSAAARKLGISRQALSYLVRQLDLL
ncbi:MAG: sigma 54-interacting transcriptional regulator [Acidobacteriota bacterium]